MLSKIEELRLISLCVISDDRRAFGKLVEAYQMRLRRFFLNLTLGNEALSDDLAQETFTKAYLSLRSFKGLSGFGTWLYRIGYNEFYSEMRRRHEESEEAGADTARSLVADDTESQTDARADAETLMRNLTPPERTAVALFYIEDCPIAKIAKIMQIPTGTVKSHLHRAKVKMKQVAEHDDASTIKKSKKPLAL